MRDVRAGRGGRARRQARAAAVRPLSRCRARSRSHALLATGAVHHHLVRDGPALQLQPAHRDRHRARSASLRLPDRLRRDRRVSVHGVPDAVRHDAQGPRARWTRRRACELGRSYRRGIRKGLLKIMSKMGISTIAQLSQRAAVRDRRPATDDVVDAVLHRHRQPHPGRGLRRPRGRRSAARRARLERHASRSSRAACSSTCTAASTTCTTRT